MPFRQRISKPVNQNETSTTYVDDDDLQVNLESGKTYHYHCRMYYKADSTGDAAFQLTFSGTTSAIISHRMAFDHALSSPANLEDPYTDNALNPIEVGSATSGYGFAELSGSLVTTSAGLLKLQLRQQAADVTGVTLYAGSFLDIEEVG